MSDSKRAKEERRDYGEQDEWGNSIASLRANLRLTPLERIRKAEAFARSVFKIRGLAHRKICD
ncbi:MAG: hypothetical protein ABIV13_00840 [Fimbriimonadales bacterium]